MEDLPTRRAPTEPLKNALLTASQDSGIGDSTILASPTSVASVPALIWTPDRVDPVAAMKSTIDGFLRQFNDIPDRLLGHCYASTFFAVGEFDGRGGVLYLKDSEPAQLLIPPGALTMRTVVYMMVQYEECITSISDLCPATLSPVFECGPDGLQFQVPVELTIPHAAAPDSEVTAVSRSPNTTSWKEDTAADGPSFLQTSTETITLRINHFTGFKISDAAAGGRRRAPSGRSHSAGVQNASTRSRIPLPVGRVQPRQSLSEQQNGKDLCIGVFKYGDKAKVYFATNSKNFHSLTDTIDLNEARHGFIRESDWKEFSFVEGKGDLNIIAKKGQVTYRKFTMDTRKVLNSHYDCVEVIATDEVLDIFVNQTTNPKCYTQFCIKLCTNVPPPHESFYERLSRVEYTMSTLELQRRPHPSGYPYTESNNNVTYARSVSESVSIRASARFPEESCDHEGACTCWRDSPSRCPTESSHSPTDSTLRPPLKRNGTTRSQESGYESSVNSPISPLRGPDTLIQNGAPLKGPESIAQLAQAGGDSNSKQPHLSYHQESMTLELHTVGGGNTTHVQSQGGRHTPRPVPAPRRGTNHGVDSSNV